MHDVVLGMEPPLPQGSYTALPAAFEKNERKDTRNMCIVATAVVLVAQGQNQGGGTCPPHTSFFSSPQSGIVSFQQSPLPTKCRALGSWTERLRTLVPHVRVVCSGAAPRTLNVLHDRSTGNFTFGDDAFVRFHPVNTPLVDSCFSWRNRCMCVFHCMLASSACCWKPADIHTFKCP